MSKNSVVSMSALIVCLSVLSVPYASAQTPAGPDGSSASIHHRQQYMLMRDMSQEMGKMAEEMSHGALTPEQDKLMTKKMKSMSTVMHRMTGFNAKYAMKEPEQDRQMNQMRKEMDSMMREPSMKAGMKAGMK